MKKEKNVSNAVIWQITSRFFQYGIGFLVTPIFTRTLTTEEYGLVATYTTWCTLITIFVGLQTRGSIANARIKFNNDKYQGYISSIMSLSLISFIIVLLLTTFFRNILGEILGFSSYLIPTMVIQGFVTYVVDFNAQRLRQDFNIKESSLISITLGIVTSFTSVMLVLYMHENKYLSKIIGTTIPYLIASILIIGIIYRNGRLLYNIDYWKYCLMLTLPVIGHSISGIIMAQSDRIMLRGIEGDSVAGIYSVVYTLANVISMIREALNQAWNPFYFKLRSKNMTAEICKHEDGYLFLYTVLSIGFILCAPEVFKIMAPKAYWSGLRLIPLLTLAIYFNFLYTFPVNYEFCNENTRIIMMASIVAAIINIGLNCMLIPIWHDIGAIVATLISSIVLLVIHDHMARRINNDFELQISFYAKGIFPMCVVCVCYYFMLGMPYLRWAIAVGLGVLIFIRTIKTRKIF